MYCVDPNSDEPIMLLNKHIGFDQEDGMGIDGSLFQSELLQLDTMGKKRIQVWINSPGGNVNEGYNIFSAILKTHTPVDTYNCGVAASMAGVIFMAGRKRIMADYAVLMIHPPSGTDNKRVIEVYTDSTVKALSANAKIPEADVRYLMERTSWLNAAECFEKGFCNEIDVTSENNKKRMSRATDAKDMMNVANSITAFPTVKNIFKNTVMTKITMKLGLNDAATEDNVIAAIKTIEDKSYQSEVDKIAAENKLKEVTNSAKAEKEALQKQLDDLNAKMVTDKAAFDSIKSKLDAMTTEKEAAEKTAKEVSARDMVTAFSKTGKIKNEAIDKWVKLAVEDFEGTKAMLEDLPLNKVAIKIDNKFTGEAGSASYNAAGIMADIAAKNSVKI